MLSSVIPVIILAGYPGAGKRGPRMSRALAVINEFGSTGLDRVVIETTGVAGHDGMNAGAGAD